MISYQNYTEQLSGIRNPRSDHYSYAPNYGVEDVSGEKESFGLWFE